MPSSPPSRLYSDEDAKRIFERALHLDGREAADKLRHEELLAAAREVGIDEDAIERAVLELERDQAETAARNEIIAERRRRLQNHLVVFVAVNLFLAALNWLLEPSYWWFVFPLLGWSLGLFFHAGAGLSRRIKPGKLERRLKRLGYRSRQASDGAPPSVAGGAPRANRTAQLVGQTVDEGVATLLAVIQRELREARERAENTKRRAGRR